jgi:hypothetical protein
MNDFLTADINELMNAKEEEADTSDERSYRVLVESDRKMINTFTVRRQGLTWPEPVTKRHIR